MLEEDDALATKTTSEEDEDCAGLKTGPGLSRVVCLANLF